MNDSRTWRTLVLLSLLLSTAACGRGGDETAPATQPTTAPAQSDAEARRQAGEEQARRAEEEARRAEEARREERERRPPTYAVETGDHLWGISGQPRIYGDPRFWPILYDANRDAIADPDLIFPGQQLDVPREMSDSEREARLRELWRELGTE